MRVLLISSTLADGPGADIDPIGMVYDPWNDAPRPGTEAKFTAMWNSGAGWAVCKVLSFLVGG
jgi:hypothetical protein